MTYRTRVLLIEDDPGLAEVLVDLIARNGRRVDHVATAEDALKSFRRERLGLIIIDVVLPGMSGLELLRIIRSESQVPVIMMSGKISPELRRQAMKLGAHEFLSKPFTPARVETCVRKALAFGVSL